MRKLLTTILLTTAAWGAGALAQSAYDDAQLHYKIALRAIENHDSRVAASELKQARDLDPQNAVVHYTLAIVLKNADPDEALASLERALVLGLPEKEKAESADLHVDIHYRVERKRAGEMFTDSATGLMWTAKDNGDDIDANGAKSYCAALKLRGFSDWRLPTIDELEQLSDRTSVSTYKIKAPLKLSGCCPWSGTTMGPMTFVYAFNFGQRWPYNGTLNCRALCVRRG